MMSFNGTRSGPEPDIDRADSPVYLFGSLPSAYEDSYYILLNWLPRAPTPSSPQAPNPQVPKHPKKKP